MLINEIVNVFTNPGAQSSFLQGAVNRLAQKAGTAGITQPSNAPGFAIDPQSRAAQASAPLVNQIAQSLNAGWSQAIQQAMTQAYSSRGVTSVKDIPRDQLKRVLVSQLNSTLNKMSNDELQDYREISKLVDPQAYGGKGAKVALDAVRELETAMGTILATVATEPSNAQQAKLSRLWQTTAEKLYTIASLATFQSPPRRQRAGAPRVTVQSGGQISIGGEMLDPADPKNAQIIATLRRQGKI
jgi:hypothetical protein